MSNSPEGAVSVKYDARPIIIELTATGLIGGKTMVLKDTSGMLELKVPAELWPWISYGDTIFMTFSPIKVTVTPVDMGLPGLPTPTVN